MKIRVFADNLKGNLSMPCIDTWIKRYFKIADSAKLTPKKHKDHPNSVFYVNLNKEIMMEYDQKNEYVYIHYDHIWSKIESLFHLNYHVIHSIMKVWLKETYKLEGVRPMDNDFNWPDGLIWL
jgi:hypothetical protein